MFLQTIVYVTFANLLTPADSPYACKSLNIEQYPDVSMIGDTLHISGALGMWRYEFLDATFLSWGHSPTTNSVNMDPLFPSNYTVLVCGVSLSVKNNSYNGLPN